MSDNSWRYLTDPNDTILGLKSDRVGMSNWINAIVQRINAIEDNKEAIKILFVINQKIGIVKGKNSPYHYPQELYDRLQVTVNMLLDKRLNA